jgi:outer membrane protein OmpA-like peptidoglycan-associated protein
MLGMKLDRLLWLFPAVVGMGLWAQPVRAQDDAERACRDALQVLDGLTAEDLSGAKAAVAKIGKACPPATFPDIVFCAGRKAALLHYDAALAISETKAPASKIFGVLGDGRRLGAPWQLLFAMGEIEQSRGRFSRATLSYSAAIEDYAGPIACSDEEATIAEMSEQERKDMAQAMLRNAEYNLLRARRLAPEQTYRCCGLSGAERPDIRGFIPDSRTLRADFVTGKTRLTADGREGLKRLAAYAKQRKLTEIVLAVHTESFGTAAEACKLARARGEVIASFLGSRLPGLKVKAIPVGDAVAVDVWGGDGTLARKLPRLVMHEGAAPAGCVAP